MVLTPGTRHGTFEIVGLLGEGGMGQVFRARDTRLGRDVALKVLPSASSTDDGGRQRQEIEAQALAALNHANIAQVFGIDETNGVTAIVMEFVDGEGLDRRLAQGPLSIREALGLSQQVAAALDAAHLAGVVHRDLKPANIKVREDGTVKVLDFGLARLGSGTARPNADARTTPPTMTEAGAIMGTAAYMAPEQARGKAVDKRADIWAFGCVLYEMLTGRRAFEGETLTDVLSAVVSREPDWQRLPADTPLPVRRLLQRCLQKDAARRLRDIGDADFSIADADAARRPPSPWWQRPVPALVIGMSLSGALGAIAWQARPERPEAEPQAVHLTIDPDPDAPIASRASQDLAISRDGRRVAFLADGPTGRLLYLRDLSAAAAVPLRGTETAEDPFFSWDGRWIVFESRAESKLMKIPIAGGPPVPIEGAGFQTRGVAWAPDDTLYYSATREIRKVPATGGTPEVVVSSDSVYTSPRILPDGRTLIFGRDVEARRIVLLDLVSRAESVVGTGSNAAYVPSGHLVFSADGRLQAVAFDLAQRRVVGEPATIAEGLRAAPQAAADFAVSDNGTLAYVTGSAAGVAGSLSWVDRGGRAMPVGSGRQATEPRLSPDGRLLAFRSDRAAWLLDLARGTESRLASGIDAQSLMWTPDGRGLTYRRVEDNGYAIETVAVGRDTPPTRVATDTTMLAFGSWLPDGRRLLAARTLPGGNKDLVLVDSAAPSLQTVVGSPAVESAPRLSPDGRFIAYVSEETGVPQVYVRGFPEGLRAAVSVDGGLAPVWSRDGRTLYFAGPESSGLQQLMSADFAPGGNEPRPGRPAAVMTRRFRLADSAGNPLYDVAPDGSRFVVVPPDSNERADNRIHVILNWPALLRESRSPRN